MLAAPIQTTLELGIPLHQVTFCVVDLETTGGSPADCRITEVGAVKYLGGERIGSFQALVNPEIPIPPFITHLTGIDDRSVSSRSRRSRRSCRRSSSSAGAPCSSPTTPGSTSRS